jgi:hypothetical protein
MDRGGGGALRSLDLPSLWDPVEENERRVLLDVLIESVTVCPDHLEVVVNGAPPLNATLEEVGLQSQIDRDRGPDYANPDWRIRPLDLGR